MTTVRDTGNEIDRLARAYMAVHDVSYMEAFHQVLKSSATLKKLYTGCEPAPVVKLTQRTVPRTAGDEVDRLVRRYIVEMDESDYAVALRVVLEANPDLCRRYVGE